KFEDIFDVDHFIEYLKNDVRIVRDIPEWFADKAELFTSIRFYAVALHLRFEKGMVGLSFCDFVGTREEKAMMAAYRQKEWPRRYKFLVLEVYLAWFMEALNSFSKCNVSYFFADELDEYNTIFLFVSQVTKEELASKEEIDHFRKHVTSLAALDFLVCLKSDVFVMTHGGNFAKLIIGARRYMGHRLKSIKPDKGLMSKSFGDPYMGWASFVEDVVITHHTRTGLPEETFPNYDIWENPLTPCMCRA
ncbi:hypothetical protein B296_00035269, partial [Ensete ventricosum]